MLDLQGKLQEYELPFNIKHSTRRLDWLRKTIKASQCERIFAQAAARYVAQATGYESAIMSAESLTEDIDHSISHIFDLASVSQGYDIIGILQQADAYIKRLRRDGEDGCFADSESCLWWRCYPAILLSVWDTYTSMRRNPYTDEIDMQTMTELLQYVLILPTKAPYSCIPAAQTVSYGF